MGVCRIRIQDLVCTRSSLLTEPSPQLPIYLPLLLVVIAIFKSNSYNRNGPQMFLNNDIYAVYPIALALFLLKYKIVFCLQPLPCSFLSSLSIFTCIFAIDMGYLKCTSVHLRSTGIHCCMLVSSC